MLCPHCIDNWLEKQRNVRFMPRISSLTSFADSWWAWWLSNQPAWRTHSSEGVLTRVQRGDASIIQVGGQAGILEFVMVLAWWGLEIQQSGDSGTMDKWMEAVVDVTWMLGIENIN